MMMDDTRVHEHEWDINFGIGIPKCWKLLGLLPDDVLSKFAFICEGKHPAKPPEGTTVSVISSGSVYPRKLQHLLIVCLSVTL